MFSYCEAAVCNRTIYVARVFKGFWDFQKLQISAGSRCSNILQTQEGAAAQLNLASERFWLFTAAAYWAFSTLHNTQTGLREVYTMNPGVIHPHVLFWNEKNVNLMSVCEFLVGCYSLCPLRHSVCEQFADNLSGLLLFFPAVMFRSQRGSPPRKTPCSRATTSCALATPSMAAPPWWPSAQAPGSTSSRSILWVLRSQVSTPPQSATWRYLKGPFLSWLLVSVIISLTRG